MQPALLITVLILFTLLFAFVSGANDGGVLIAMGVRHPFAPVGWLVILLAVVLVVAPVLLGTGVARTLALGLVPPGTRTAFLSFVIGVSVSLAVVLWLSRRGLPTSLTLAIVGGITGAGVGLAAPVSWATVGLVLGIGAVAPGLGWLLGHVIARAARRVPSSRWMPKWVIAGQVSAFLALCLAYAVNDGQKMLAVAAVATLAVPGETDILAADGTITLVFVLIAMVIVFVIGLLSTIRAVTLRISFDLTRVQPVDGIIAQYAAAASVLASSLVGAPVSMTQAVAGGLVGTSSSKGVRRVRWQSVTRIAAAWAVTLPAAGVGAWVVGVAAHRMIA